jgi:hypothetical protein
VRRCVGDQAWFGIEPIERPLLPRAHRLEHGGGDRADHRGGEPSTWSSGSRWPWLSRTLGHGVLLRSSRGASRICVLAELFVIGRTASTAGLQAREGSCARPGSCVPRVSKTIRRRTRETSDDAPPTGCSARRSDIVRAQVHETVPRTNARRAGSCRVLRVVPIPARARDAGAARRAAGPPRTTRKAARGSRATTSSSSRTRWPTRSPRRTRRS